MKTYKVTFEYSPYEDDKCDIELEDMFLDDFFTCMKKQIKQI